MKLASFSIITILSLTFAGLTLVETAAYRAWDRAVTEQKQIQAKLTFYQRRGGVAEQLVRRLAIESQHDPAIAEFLKQHQIKVVINTGVSTQEEPGIEAPPSAPGQPAPAPASSTPSHP